MFEFVKTRNEKEIKNEISRTIAGEFDFANKMYLAYSILKSRYPNVYKCDLTDFMDLYKNLISIANSYELETGEKIDKNIKANVKLFFRVTNTFRDCTIKVKCGEQVIMEKKKKIAVPGEMETLILSEDKLKLASAPLEVCLEV